MIKYPFGTIKDSRRKDIFSIIINQFPIFSYFIIDFRNYNLGAKQFNNPDNNMKARFLYILGFHIWTKDVK